MESCCPAEEERLRRRGRTFEDPEEFRHVNQIASLVSKQADPRNLCENQHGDNTGQQLPLQHLSYLGKEYTYATTGMKAISTSDREANSGRPSQGVGHIETLIDSDMRLNKDAMNLENLQVGESSRRSPTNDTQDQIHDETTQMKPQDKAEGKIQKEEKTDEEENEFKPTTVMSARAVVRERRQWALRRARRQEGPNETNQLELGGGPSEGSGSWEAGNAGDSIHGKEKSVNVADGGGTVVALLVSLPGSIHRLAANWLRYVVLRFYPADVSPGYLIYRVFLEPIRGHLYLTTTGERKRPATRTCCKSKPLLVLRLKLLATPRHPPHGHSMY